MAGDGFSVEASKIQYDIAKGISDGVGKTPVKAAANMNTAKVGENHIQPQIVKGFLAEMFDFFNSVLFANKQFFQHIPFPI